MLGDEESGPVSLKEEGHSQGSSSRDARDDRTDDECETPVPNDLRGGRPSVQAKVGSIQAVPTYGDDEARDEDGDVEDRHGDLVTDAFLCKASWCKRKRWATAERNQTNGSSACRSQFAS